MSSKVKQLTVESFYRKRLCAVDPIWEEYYLKIAEKLVEKGYESPRLLDNIIESLPREFNPEFYSVMIKVNPKMHDNSHLAEKKMGRAIVAQLIETSFLNEITSDDDPQIAQKQKQQTAVKKQILQKKLIAVRQGSQDVTASHEPEGEMVESIGDQVRKGLKRHSKAVEKKKIKNRKAVPYAALAAEHQPEGEMVEELSRRSKPSAKAKMAKLDAILKRREERKVTEKEALKTEGWLGKKKEEKKPQKAMDAGARAKRKLQRKEYAAKVSGSEDNVPDDIREGVRQAAGNALGYAARVGAGIVGAGVQALSQKETIPKVSGAKKGGSSTSSNQGGMSAAQSQAEKAKKARVDARKKAIKKIKDDRRDRATNIMTAEKAAKKVKKEGEDKKFQADSGKPIVAEFVDHLWEASKKCSKCGKVYKGKSCSCCA